jgi:hypothetical protein
VEHVATFVKFFFVLFVCRVPVANVPPDVPQPASVVLDVPTCTARCPSPDSLAVTPGNIGREMAGEFSLKSSDFHVTLGIFYMPKICDMGQTDLLLRRKTC